MYIIKMIIEQGPFFMRNSQLFHELVVSESYTKDMEKLQVRHREEYT